MRWPDYVLNAMTSDLSKFSMKIMRQIGPLEGSVFILNQPKNKANVVFCHFLRLVQSLT